VGEYGCAVLFSIGGWSGVNEYIAYRELVLSLRGCVGMYRDR